MMSRNLGLNGAGQIPLDLMALAAKDPPHWEDLVNSAKFNSIVREKVHGVIMRHVNISKRSSKTAVVTWCVNVPFMKEFSEYFRKMMDKSFADWERKGLDLYSLIDKSIPAKQHEAMDGDKKQGSGGKVKK